MNFLGATLFPLDSQSFQLQEETLVPVAEMLPLEAEEVICLHLHFFPYEQIVSSVQAELALQQLLSPHFGSASPGGRVFLAAGEN